MNYCNLDYIKSVTPDSYAFPIQILELFLAETPDSIKAIKNEIEASNWGEVYAKAHHFKPSITMLGFHQKISGSILQINVLAKSETNMHQIT